jgi:uncharacterized membrane protein
LSWIVLALFGAAVAGMINILDKTLLYRYLRSPLTLPFLIGMAQGSIGIIMVLAVTWPETATASSIRWSLFSGALWGLSAWFLLRVLFSQEVSRTVPVYQTFPIFTALLAVVFLGEDLSAVLWIAIVATVAGAVLISLRLDQGYRGLFLHRSFFPLMLGSAIAAAAHVTGKIALDDLPVLNTHALRSLGLSGVLLLGALRPAPLREVRDLLVQRSPAFAILGMNEVVLASSSMLLTLWALSLGPVSLVTTLVATRSFFVLLYSTALALRFTGFLGEETSARSLTVKIVSTSLIVAGVAAIALK